MESTAAERDAKIAICGLQRSGTNYLESIISKLSPDAVIDKTFPKHSFPGEISEELLKMRSIVLISRHPCMWLQSCMINSSADLTETKTEFFLSKPQEVAFAKIYSKFYREWLEFITNNGGVKIRHEQILRGDLDRIDAMGDFPLNINPRARRVDTTITRVPHSLEFTATDRNKELNRECSLSSSTINIFISNIDKDLVDQLGYDLHEINFNRRQSPRSIAYRILRQPHSVSDEDLTHFLEETNDTFNDNPKLCQAIGAKIARGGDLRKAIRWHELAANAKSSDPNETFAEACTVKLDALEQIVDLENKVDKLHRIEEPLPIRNDSISRYVDEISNIRQSAQSCLSSPNSRFFSPAERSEILFVISDTFRRTSKFLDAEEYIRLAIQITPHLGRYHQALGALFLTQGRLDQAEISLKRAIELEPLDVVHRVLLSDIFIGQKRFEEALAELSCAIDFYGPEPKLLHHQGQVLGRLGRWDAAEAALRQAIVSEPADAFHRHLLSWTLEHQDRLTEAVDEAERCTGCENAEPWHWHHLGALLIRTGRLGDAEATLRRAILLDPADARHHFVLSDIFERQGRLDEAAAEAEASLRGVKVEPWHFHHCGLLLAALGRLDPAETRLREATRADPAQWRSHLELSCLLGRRARIGEAIRAAEAAIAAGGDGARIHRQYGLLLARTGHLAKAKPHLARALQMAPRRSFWPNQTTLVYALCRLLTVAQPAP